MEKVDYNPSNAQLRRDVLWRFGCVCGYCGCDINELNFEVDHIVSKAALRVFDTCDWFKIPEIVSRYLDITPEKVNEASNLMPSCKRCNQLKSKWDLATFKYIIWHSEADRKRFDVVRDKDGETVIFFFEKLDLYYFYVDTLLMVESVKKQLMNLSLPNHCSL